MTQPDDSDNMSNDTQKIIALLENQVVDFKTQLEKAEQCEMALIEEKKELWEMLKAEHARTLALTSPAQNGKKVVATLDRVKWIVIRSYKNYFSIY